MTRRLQFFMLPSEFEEFLIETSHDLSLTVLLDQQNSTRIRLPNDGLPKPPHSWPVRLYLASAPPESDQVTGPARPREWGWLQVDAPLERGGTLYLAEVAFANGPQTATGAATRRGSKTYGRIASRLRRLLHGPITITNHVTGASMTAAAPLFSKGAAELVRRGGTLQQYAVPNLRFKPD
jgi:hypothetical protein